MGDDLDEIIVTARRTPERLGEVPLTLNAFGKDTIEARGIDSLQSLIAHAPGLYFESTWGGLFSAPTLRGQQLGPDGDLNVGVFVDGVYQANQIAVDTGALDLQRIEVVRGPQNTLYGHSTFAGAIHFVSRAPSERPESGITLNLGTDEYRAAQAYVSGPIFGASVLGRLAAGTAHFDGTQSNSALDGAALGGWDKSGTTLQLATPDDTELQATLSLRISRATAEQPAVSALTYTDYNCGGIESASGAWSYYCDAAPIRDVFDISPGLPDSTNDVHQSALAFSWPALGGQIESLTSYYRGDADTYRDFDISSAGQEFGVCTVDINCLGPVGIPRTVNRLAMADEVSRHLGTVRETSQNLRWRSAAAERLQWMIGAAAWWTDQTDESRLGVARGDLADDERYTAVLPEDPLSVGPLSLVNNALVADPARLQNTQAMNRIARRTLALFGSIDYALTESIRMRAELRATREHRSVENQTANFAPGFGTAIPAQDFDDITPRFSLQYAPSESLSGYVSAAKGSRSGGINPLPALLPDEQSFAPEYNWTYELNGRYRNAPHDFSLQTTLYYIDWRDTQMSGFPDTPGISNLITRNTKGVVTRGLELTLQARLLQNLRTEVSYSYTDPSFRAGSDDPGSRRFCGLSGGNTTSTFCTIGPSRSGSVTALVPYIDGNLLPRTPKEMWHAALVYEAPPVRGGDQLIFRIDANGQDDVFDRAINGARFGSRVLLDARLSFDFGNWSIALWGRNLEDVHYVRALASRGQVYFPTTPRPLDMIYGDGRRLGLTLSYVAGNR